MNITSGQKKLLLGLAIGCTSTLIAGMFLLYYEYSFLKGSPDHSSPQTLPFWKGNRTISVRPVQKWSQFVLFNPRRYYKVFEIKLYGGDVGFPPNTAIQVTTSTGKILQLTGPEAIKPTLANGISAIDWIDNKYKDSTKTVFVTGPNAEIQASMHVIIISKGKDVPDSALKLLVSSPSNKPLDVDYDTDVKWTSSE